MDERGTKYSRDQSSSHIQENLYLGIQWQPRLEEVSYYAQDLPKSTTNLSMSASRQDSGRRSWTA